MPGRPRADDRSELAATPTERTLRDVLHELPVDALVPDGWRVGTEVVQFGDRLPRDAVTLAHPDYPRDLVVTTAGATGDEALVVHERDRVVGRRTVVAGVAGADDRDRETVREALAAAARAAARIETGEAGEATVGRGEPSLSLSGAAGTARRTLNFH